MKIVYLLATIVVTFFLLFATSFLLDLEFISSNIIRVILVYLLIGLEVYIGFSIYKQLSK